MIDAYASLPHYWTHLAPIVEELRTRDVHVRTWAARPGDPWGAPIRTRPRHDPTVVLVAAYVDARAFRAAPVIYVEHGAGQSYRDDVGAPGWPGARGLDHVRLFVCPGDHVAGAWRAQYPQAAVETVGSPHVDSLLAIRQEPEPATVALSFRWNCQLCPEARSAFDHYDRALPDIIDRLRDTYRVVGHGHPRVWPRLRKRWEALGVEPVRDFGQIWQRAAIFVADNTSALYEFAASGRPVICMNAPWYRRDVDHGLRFWSHVPGVQVDDASGIPDAVKRARAGEGEALRARAVAHVYAHRDGTAASRAADAIQEATDAHVP